jgi:two-component system, OmpR family, KDP operon response regulator KdpE
VSAAGAFEFLKVMDSTKHSGYRLREPDCRTIERDTESAKVSALDLGADDYVTKPFGIDELLARIRTAQRHRLAQEGEKPLFHGGDLCVDLVRRVMSVRNEKVQFSPREYEVLRLLVAHAGKF